MDILSHSLCCIISNHYPLKEEQERSERMSVTRVSKNTASAPASHSKGFELYVGMTKCHLSNDPSLMGLLSGCLLASNTHSVSLLPAKGGL